MRSKKIQLFVIEKNEKSACFEKYVKEVALKLSRTFVYQQNIFGILSSSDDPNNYVLILRNSRICKVVFDSIQIEKEHKDQESAINLSKLSGLLKLIKVENRHLSNLFKNQNFVTRKHSLSNYSNQVNVSLMNEEIPTKEGAIDQGSRKRHHSLFGSCNKIIKASNFEIIKNQWEKSITTKLIIFGPLDRSQCYEYSYNRTTKLFNCLECRKMQKIISARLCRNGGGKHFVKLLSAQHVSEPREYNPDKYKFDPSKQIVDCSNYQVFNYSQKGKPKSTLILFCPTNKKLCYEYFWNNRAQNYTCCGCGTRVSAVICKNEDGSEYLKLNKAEHICDLREVDLTKFKDDIMIQKPMFEVVERSDGGIKKKFLLIFIDPKKEMCYKFAYTNTDKGFYCVRCGYKRNYVRACVKKHKNGEECVYVYDRKHLCNPIEYATVIKNNIVKAPNYQLLKRKVNGKLVQHLIMFTNEDRNECYEYTWIEKKGKYICNPCKEHKIGVYAKLHKTEESDEEFVELRKNQHKCVPRKFTPEISIKHVFEPDFKADEYILNGLKRVRIILFDKTDKNLCYYYYKETPGKDTFYCTACHLKHKYVTAKLLQNGSNHNYIELNDTEHVCEPQQITVLTIEKPNFKLEECKVDGFKRNFIIIFDQIDKSYCYRYRYYGTDKAYLCDNCRRKMNILVTARLKKDKDGEQYVALNKTAHICQPIKYNPSELRN